MEKQAKKCIATFSQRLVLGNKTYEVGSYEVSTNEAEELAKLPFQNSISLQ